MFGLTDDMLIKKSGYASYTPIKMLTEKYAEVSVFGYCGSGMLKMYGSGSPGLIQLKINGTL